MSRLAGAPNVGIMTTMTVASGSRTPFLDRVPAPDIARGAMLLLIAVANVPFWTSGASENRSD